MTEGTDMNQIEKVARALAKADGLDFDEVCGVDANPDDGYCDSGTCVAAHWEEHDAEQARRWYMHLAKAAIAAMPVQAEPVAKRWQLGDKVKKKANSSWRGVVCGFYNTPATPNGYSVVSLYEPGSVQVWPEAALEDWDGVMVEDELRAEITRLTEALRAAEERETALREDKARLDYLDKCNHRLNSRYGTSYGWKLILNHNVNRLMLDTPSGMAVDLHDTEGGSAKFTSCRKAIDESMLRAAIAGAKP